ncbi:MAG TPA: polymer-forming cytoskeletal protein [Caulobacteraceae bacterium]
MFSKTNKPAPGPAPRSAAPPQLLEPPVVRKNPAAVSVIGKDITIEGGVNGEGEVHIDGVVRGDVRVGRLSVGESGHVEGTISAELVEVRGKVVGAITAKQIRLFATAHVDGDITHEQLAMETGASFQGRSLKFQRPTVQREATSQVSDVINLSAAQV